MGKRLFKKAFRDLFQNKRKAVVALLAIFIGMIAFGTLLFSGEIITNELVTTYTAIKPPSASLAVNQVDDRLVQMAEDTEAIDEYQVKTQYSMRGQKANGEWTTVELFAAEDFANEKLNKMLYKDGKHNPGQNEVLMDRDAMSVSGKKIGDDVTIELPNGTKKTMKIAGEVADLTVHPATMHNTIYVYVSMQTLDSLGLKPNRLDFTIKDTPYEREQIMRVGNDFLKSLEDKGYQIQGLSVANTPGISMHLEEYKTALTLLRAFAFVAFLFGCLIMSSLITSILSKQVRQIGILKSFGTKGKNILLSYLLALACVIVVATVIAVPASKLLANVLSGPLLRISNMDLVHTQTSMLYYVAFAALSLIVPIIITFFSVRRATKITIKDAISDNEQSSKKTATVGIQASFLQRPALLTLRNAFRKKGRLLLNVTTLALSGLCFIVILVSMMSVSGTLEDNLQNNEYDYRFITKSGQNKEIKDTLEKEDKVKEYEEWSYCSGKYIDDKGQVGSAYPVYGVEQGSEFIKPEIAEGRWYKENQAREIVVSHKFIEDHEDAKVGDLLQFEIAGKKLSYQIVGVIKDFNGANLYMSKNQLLENVPVEATQSLIEMKLTDNISGREKSHVLEAVEKNIVDNKISVLQSETKTNAIKMLNSHYMSTFQTFLIIIGMVLIVSAFGLTSTTNIQTMERIREIGIMKSMGASRKQIMRIITSESVLTSLIGWLASALLAIPGIYAGIAYFSATTLEATIHISVLGVIIAYVSWFVLVLLIGKLASRRTAKRAAKMTIRESLIME